MNLIFNEPIHYKLPWPICQQLTDHSTMYQVQCTKYEVWILNLIT